MMTKKIQFFLSRGFLGCTDLPTVTLSMGFSYFASNSLKKIVQIENSCPPTPHRRFLTFFSGHANINGYLNRAATGKEVI